MILPLIIIGLIQIFFAFACIRVIQRKGRLNIWWIFAALLLGLPAYAAALWVQRRRVSTDK